ncbi:unnamed protein product [Pseudo-nitzschia multistriata]|uniref:Casein kinase substrate phosphoprotein PP28 domain-containing protein n=1 Tax=Pseudo-nitzschia multistriata TaxID=183589 RepID=A0A448ZI75_9STRA|nr:unnamed protein product [Pseudo-nitzschia multistriata]
MTKFSFLGGALSFKGDKKKSKKKSKKSKVKHKLKDEEATAKISRETEIPHHNRDDVLLSDDEDELTDAEKKALKFKKERQQEENKKIAAQSHRERVEALNEKLGNMTELNDIPRVSAAGNG